METLNVKINNIKRHLYTLMYQPKHTMIYMQK